MPYVSVRALSNEGKAMVLVEGDTTIAELKLKVQERMQVPARSQCLVYKGRDLKNAQTIDDCKIDEATSITLFSTSTDVASVVSHGSSSTNLGLAGYGLGLLVNDDIEALVGLCAANVVIYHNPSSESAPMYGRYFGIEGLAMWLDVCQKELKPKGKPHLFNFSSSGNYVFCEMEKTVTVTKTSKIVTLSRIIKFVFNADGKIVVWDVMEDSAALEQAYQPEVFRAPDGTPFQSRRQVFKYWFNFTDREGETLIRHPGEINGQPFDVTACKDCTIILADYTNQVRLDDLENCRIFVGASSESVWLRGCKNCKVTVACKEFRTFDTTDCEIHVLCMTAPVVERSSGISLLPFNGKYALMQRHFTAAGLDVYKNQYQKVSDYSKDDSTIPTPRFTLNRVPNGNWELNDEITEKRLEASTRVEARYGKGTVWYAGTICTSNADGSYKILYDDGDIENEVAGEFVRTI
jgi:hypothetical protein